jgi:hypothetical protein
MSKFRLGALDDSFESKDLVIRPFRGREAAYHIIGRKAGID